MQDTAENTEDEPEYTPLTLALQGKLELSHLHVQTEMNMLLHTEDGGVSSAVAYSRRGEGKRVIIGDPLPLVFVVRWVDGEDIPVGGGGAGGVFLGGLVGVVLGAAAVMLGKGEVGRRVMRRIRGERAGGLIGVEAGSRARGYGGYGLPAGAPVTGGYGYPGVKRKD